MPPLCVNFIGPGLVRCESGSSSWPFDQFSALSILSYAFPLFLCVYSFPNIGLFCLLSWRRQLRRNNRVLRTIFTSLHSLRTLELTGDSRTWSPELLLSQLSPGIRHFAIIMPDRRVSNALVPIAERLGGELRSLNVLCKVRWRYEPKRKAL